MVVRLGGPIAARPGAMPVYLRACPRCRGALYEDFADRAVRAVRCRQCGQDFYGPSDPDAYAAWIMPWRTALPVERRAVMVIAREQSRRDALAQSLKLSLIQRAEGGLTYMAW